LPCREAPLEALRALITESRIDLPPDLPPMAAGIFGYLGYDMVRLMEQLPEANPDPVGIPDAVMVRPTIVVVFDAVKDSITAVTPVRPEKDLDAKAALARAVERLSNVVESLDRPLDQSFGNGDAGPIEVQPQSNTTPAEYKAMVRKAKEYIAAGDAFQIVLAQRFEAPFTLPPFSLYRALRRTNPSPYLYFLDFGGFAIAGSSPEILVKVAQDVVTIRPIAGTRWRGKTPHEDKALEEQLLADPKERAEHLMLLDLGRNDVGRVAEVGTVRVTDQFFVERYSHVMHIVSNVEGKLRGDMSAYDALRACFPAGTLSGAPKIRAMEIISELEPARRGTYGGAVGYFDFSGNMDTAITIRTLAIKDGVARIQCGGGVVYDSVPETEYRETLTKAGAMLAAIDRAEELEETVLAGSLGY